MEGSPVIRRERAHPRECSLIVVGDEILEGFVQDLNSQHIARTLREHGVRLRDVQVVEDDPAEISRAVRQALHRPRPRLVLTCGGVGFTPDDVTLQGIGLALRRPLLSHPRIIDDVRRSVGQANELGVDISDEDVRRLEESTLVPRGAVIHDCGGWVGAVELRVGAGVNRHGGATVLALPGVPQHLARVMDEVVVPRFLDGEGPSVSYRDIPHVVPEVAVAPWLEMLRADHGGVDIGSYPGDPSVLRLRGESREVDRAAARLASLLAAVDEGLVETADLD